MKILVTGGRGQLGSEFAALHSPEIICLPRETCDITHPESLRQAVRAHQPKLIVNTAAYTAVDKAESEEHLAYAINEQGVENLALVCRDFEIPLIHFSTDYVFDGSKAGAYLEDDLPNPQTVYGKSKWAGEEILRKTWDQHFIIRVSWVFGRYGQNFVKTILRLAHEKENLNIVSDQKGCPTSTRSIVQRVLAITECMNTLKQEAESIPFGTYHYANTPATNWFEFAKAIVECASQNEALPLKTIHPICSDEYPRPAKRPLNSVLDLHKIQKVFDILPHSWIDELQRLIPSPLRGEGACRADEGLF